MSKNRVATALTAVSLVAIVTACAGPGSGPKSASMFGGNSSDVGVATRAQMALATNDIVTAVSLAERAAEKSPRDANVRTLLGNCYLAAGRFAKRGYQDGAMGLLPGARKGRCRQDSYPLNQVPPAGYLLP